MFFILFPDVEKLATCQKSPQSQMFVLVVLCLYVCVHGKKKNNLLLYLSFVDANGLEVGYHGWI